MMDSSFSKSCEQSEKRIKLSEMSTPADQNTLVDPGYQELCNVLKQLVQLFIRNNCLINKQCELLTSVSKLLKQVVNVNNNSLENSDTPLHYAIQLKNLEFVEMLLQKGADVNAKNDKLETPLHLAVCMNATNVIQLLLKNGADLNIFNHNGYTPFHFLLKFCDERIINFLLVNKLNFVVSGNSRKQCLQIAIARDSLKMVQFILDNSGELKEEDKTDSTILCEAINKGNIEIVKSILKKGYNVSTASEPSESYYLFEPIPLHIAIQSRFEVIIKLLLNYNADVNNRDKFGQSALHKAIINHRSADIINLLLGKGANLKAKNNFGMTPLMYATVLNYELVPVLLGNNPDKNDKDNKLAFCLSFIEDEEFIIREDFIHGISNWCDKDSTYNRVFLFKSYTKEKCAVKLFVECGFTLYIEDFNDVYVPENLYHYVDNIFKNENCKTSFKDVLSLKEVIDPKEIDRYFLIYKVLIGSVQKGFTDIVHNLMTPFVNVNAHLRSGYTLFLEAILYEHLPIAKELLRHGADVNAVHNVNKMTALHLAVLNNDLDTVSFLLKNNAYIDARDKLNRTPLFLAVWKGLYNIILSLLNAGANSNLVDVKERSPLFVAINKASGRLIRILLNYGALLDAADMYTLNENCFRNVLCTSLFEHNAFNFNLIPDHFRVIGNQKFMVKFSVCKGSNLNIPTNSKTYNFQIECQNEIEKMKLTRIEGSNLSIHDVLIKSTRQIATYLRNENIVQVLETMDLTKIYPLFGSKLEVHLRKGKIAVQLLQIGYQCLKPILKFVFPAVVLHKILSYFDNKELRYLIFASRISDELKSLVEYKDEDEDEDDNEDEDEDEDEDDNEAESEDEFEDESEYESEDEYDNEDEDEFANVDEDEIDNENEDEVANEDEDEDDNEDGFEDEDVDEDGFDDVDEDGFEDVDEDEFDDEDVDEDGFDDVDEDGFDFLL